MRRLKSFFAGCFLLLSLLLAANAGAVTPTPEQLKIFQQLSPEKQRQLIDAYNSDHGQTPLDDKPISHPKIVTPRKTEADKTIEENAAKAADSITLTEPKEERVVRDKIKQFGYDLFAGSPSTFAPATDIPIPSDYVLGPGDSVIVQLYGKENVTHELQVSREGVLQFPGIGPICIAGLCFEELKGVLNETISRQIIGVKASITLGNLRSIRIFVLGEAHRPGSYTVSALSTMTNALFVSGGITPLGSLRNIQLKRKGKVVARMDLYDLLLKGDTSNDVRLLPGDVIFIPPINRTVGISGEIRRPAIYELKNEKTAGEVVALAGGLLPTSYPRASRIERINGKGERTLVDVDLTRAPGRQTMIKDGDVVQIFSVLDKIEDVVLVTGHVLRPGGMSWYKGIRVSDVVASINELMPNPDLDYALIKREIQPTRSIKVLRVHLGKALEKQGSENDLFLDPRDELLAFGLKQDRLAQVKPVVNQLKLQCCYSEYPKIVTIQGNVRCPGTYPLYEGMTLRGLIESCFDLRSESDLSYVVIKRRIKNEGKINVFSVNLHETASNELKLAPLDEVYIFGLNENRAESLQPVISDLKMQARKGEKAQIVNVSGQVRFPGHYPLEEGMTVDDLVKKAGGLTDHAFALAAEVTRYLLSQEDEQTIDHYPVSLAGQREGLSAFFLEPQDVLHVKRLPNWGQVESVTLRGEIRFPGIYNISKGETLSKVLSRAGGLTEFADPKAAIFLREELKKLEKERYEQYSRQLTASLAAKSVEQTQDAEVKEAIVVTESLVDQLNSAKPVGRLVIDLPQLLSATDNISDLVLKDGDVLHVPGISQEVSVVGEVQYPSSHLFEKKFDVDDYLDASGGFTAKSDKKHIYVVKANGHVVPYNRTKWFDQKKNQIEAGDTIVVPYDVEAVSSMTYWGNISKILFELSTTAASLKAIGTF